MTTVDQVAPLDPAAAPYRSPLDPAAAAPMPVASRLIGAIAVGVALLSATATFLVLAGLTPIAPVHEVVVELLLAISPPGFCCSPSSAGKSGWSCGRAGAATPARGCTCRSSACSR